MTIPRTAFLLILLTGVAAISPLRAQTLYFAHPVFPSS